MKNWKTKNTTEVPSPVVEDRVAATKREFAAATSADDFPEYDEVNTLSVDKSLQRFLTASGLVWRFINWPKYLQNANMHPTQWKPYVVPDDAPKGNATWKFGMDANSMIRRGDLVLAVKPIALHEQHKKVLAERNRIYKQFEDKKAEDFREFARERGVKTQVTQGD